MADSGYDVLVMGAGSAGTSAGRAAAAAGARTLVVNEGELGGLCILRGCMPTKAMLHSAHALHEARHLEPLGGRLVGRVEADFPKIIERKNAQVARFKAAKVRGIESSDYELRMGRASFLPDGRPAIDGQPVAAKRVVIATGSVPKAPPIEGLEETGYLTSDEIMELRERAPASLVVQGAGPIGLELAQFFARIGTEVLLCNRTPLLSRYGAPALGVELGAALAAEENMTLAIPARVTRVAKEGEGIRFSIDEGGKTRSHVAEAFLVATGRRANVEGLGLEHVGVELKGHSIAHDLAMQTTNPNVFVAGDATNDLEILHIANQEGAVAGHNAAVGKPELAMDYRLMMGVIFTDPCFAHVGLMEPHAEAQGIPIVVGRARFPETGRAITMNVEHGAWHLVVHRETGEILGSAICGPRADDLVHVISTLMYYRGTVDDVLRMPWYHPTLDEVILNLVRDVQLQRAASSS